MDKKRRDAFLKTIKEEGPQSFAATLDAYFPDPDAQASIKNAFNKMALPLPRDTTQCMPGTDGILLFSNRFGLVIRIEQKEQQPMQRSQWILQPLATVDAGDAVVEICPACLFEDDKENYHFVKAALKAENINFWDTGLRNMGRLPFVTDQFPQGVPVVVDRRAVKMVKGVSADLSVDDAGLQDVYYQPLRNTLTDVLSGKSKGEVFLALCEKFVADGLLVAGWNDYRPLVDNKWEGDNAKGLVAGEKAAAYDALLAPQAAKAATSTLNKSAL